METLIKQNGKCEISVFVLGFVNKVRSVVEGGLRLGKVIGNEAGETVFRTLGSVGRGFHFVGFAFNAVFIVVDIYTLVKTSVDVHKGSKVKVAKDIRTVAKVLEDEMVEIISKADKDP